MATMWFIPCSSSEAACVRAVEHIILIILLLLLLPGEQEPAGEPAKGSLVLALWHHKPVNLVLTQIHQFH